MVRVFWSFVVYARLKTPVDVKLESLGSDDFILGLMRDAYVLCTRLGH